MTAEPGDPLGYVDQPGNTGVPGDRESHVAWSAHADVVVVGSGVAGLTAALTAADAGLRTLVVTKGELEESNTRWAQGGIAVVLGGPVPPGEQEPTNAGDSIDRHVRDTLDAGGGLCDPAAVASIIAGGPGVVRDLRRRGAVFDADNGTGRGLARTREGGHSAYRVIHAGGDATGAEVERALAEAARARERVTARGAAVLQRHTAVEVRRGPGGVRGLAVLADDGTVGELEAPAVVLATGGLGQLYHATTNPDVATADGIALALRAGAAVADLEFVQFHPTVLFTGSAAAGRRSLVTEAVRGEGAILLDGAGNRVMAGVHPSEDLAPRDVVSAAVTRRLAERPGSVGDRVFLDATHLSSEKFAERFPTVYAACRAAGIDPGQDPIPVAPAAHFGCGGVFTDAHGRTEVPGLYAVGEVARTGLHGANRLASNSLLEGLVTGTRVVEALRAPARQQRPGPRRAIAAPTLPELSVPDRAGVQLAMSRYAGIGRDTEGLERLASLLATERAAPARRVRTRADVEDSALGLASVALVAAAAARTETRGCHVRNDYPASDPRWCRSLLVRLDGTGTPVVHSAFDRPGANGGAA